jgi:hypothetical protein
VAIGPLLNLIRFPSMIDEEFCRVVGLFLINSSRFTFIKISVPTHVLSDAQVVQVIEKANVAPFSREPRMSELQFQTTIKCS